jgi:hypothetical protein
MGAAMFFTIFVVAATLEKIAEARIGNKND